MGDVISEVHLVSPLTFPKKFEANQDLVPVAASSLIIHAPYNIIQTSRLTTPLTVSSFQNKGQW
jgi:hypothetical protein